MRKLPIDTLIKPIDAFIHRENTSGLILFLSLVLSMIWVNSPYHQSYHNFWETPVNISAGNFQLNYTLHHWINDGLMSIFFFVVGLELKREFIGGELASPKKAILPIAAAAGGMIFPALIYLYFNQGTSAASGWGIPMATDIAFAVGLLAFVNNRVPAGLKVFLTALAIADDLGAVLVIALFYTKQLSLLHLGVAVIFSFVLLSGNLLGIRKSLFYVLIGLVGIWLPMLLSGVHATIAGVIIAFLIPARTRVNEEEYVKNIRALTDEFEKEIPDPTVLLTTKQHVILQNIKEITAYAETPLQKIESALHPWVAYIIMPLFALSNAGMSIHFDFFSNFKYSITSGVAFGLVAGKFIGVTLTSFLLVKLKIAYLPKYVTWLHMAGAGLFAGIGFTMSLFIAGLAFTDPLMIEQAKYGIIAASTLSALLGMFVFRLFIPPVQQLMD